MKFSIGYSYSGMKFDTYLDNNDGGSGKVFSRSEFYILGHNFEKITNENLLFTIHSVSNGCLNWSDRF